MTDEQKQRAKERHAKWREANREKLRAKDRERSRALYAARADFVKSQSKAWREANPGRSAEMARTWREKYPEKSRDQHLRKYGITAAQWDAIFAAQGNQCGACRATEPGGRGWHTDHDHNTGAVRGILCHRCNVTLGNLGDDKPGIAIGSARLTRYLDGPINPNNLPANAGLLFCL